MSEQEVTVEATLTGSAAKLLLHLLRVGPGKRETPALMRGAGVNDRKTFYAAKAQLEAAGLWDNPTWFSPQVGALSTGEWDNPTPVVGNPPVVWGKTPVGGGQPYTWTPEEAARLAASATVPWTPTFHLDTASTAQVPADERNFAEVSEETARQRCAAADRLPGGGDPLRPTSEFQARRQAQVKALCMAWSGMFPTQPPLTALAAKQLLQAGNNCAEDVYDALDAARNRGVEWPAAYAKKVLSDTPKAPATPHPSGSPAAAPENHQGEMLEWTPEWEARVRRGEEKLRKLGYGHLLGDDA